MKNRYFLNLQIGILVLGASCILLMSCQSDYLDRRPQTTGYDFDAVYSDSANYWNYCHYLVINAIIPHLGAYDPPISGSWDDISDNSISTTIIGSYGGITQSHLVAAGNYLALCPNPISGSGGNQCRVANLTTWQNFWRHLRVANTGIQNIESYTGGEFTRNRILGMCYFYRGFIYMDLTRRWGGMPYLTDPLLSNDNMDMPRLSMQETYLRAAEDFDEAAKYLRDVIPANEFQHPTRIAALAMKSRCLLYAASDQARNENHPSNPRANLWEEAAIAADYALKEAELNGYSLVPWGASENGDDGYYYIFKGQEFESFMLKEVLFGRRARVDWGISNYTQNVRPPGQLSGMFGVAPNQLFIDCFEMNNGLPITDPASGYKEQDPYNNRDKRFYHNIMYNGSVIMGRTLEIWNWNEATNAADARDCVMEGGNAALGYTCTGTYERKWMGKDWNQNLFACWPLIRLAEVYLNFAEAANEAWGNPDQTRGSCAYSAAGALNMIRNRAGQPDIDSKFLAQNAFRERTRNERRIELCFEEHRVYDLRRWLVGTQPEYRDIYKQQIVKLAPGYDANVYPTGFRFDKSELYMQRVFEDRHYLFPIYRSDTQLGPNFNQNSGW